MEKVLLGCLLSLILGTVTRAQKPSQGISKEEKQAIIEAKAKFLKTFKKTQKSLPNQAKKEEKLLDTRPVSIPKTLLPFFPEGTDRNKTIGLSNPCMKKSSALEMAKLRAKVMKAVKANCKVRYVADLYTSDLNSENLPLTSSLWEGYGEISTTFDFKDQSLMLVDSHYNHFGEALIRGVSKGVTKSTEYNRDGDVKVTISFYHKRNRKGDRKVNLRHYDYKVKKCSSDDSIQVIDTYSLVQTPFGVKVQSSWYGNQLPQCNKYFRYNTAKKYNSDLGNLGKYSLSMGLWAAYFRSLVDRIIVGAQKAALKSKSVKESTQNEFESLIRSVTKRRYHINSQKIILKNNRLFTDFSLKTQQF
jgi:hypothetical protein